MADSLLITAGDDLPSGQYGSDVSAPGAVGAGSGPGQSTTNAPLVDVAILLAYIRRVVPALMEDDGVMVQSFRDLLQSDAAIERMKHFISEPQIQSVLIQRQVMKGKQINPGL